MDTQINNLEDSIAALESKLKSDLSELEARQMHLEGGTSLALKEISLPLFKGN